MASSADQAVLVVSPRYADDVAAMVTRAGFVPRIERRVDAVANRFAAEPLRIAVVDARGALDQGLGVARAIGPEVQGRHGAMLVLLSRSDATATAAAHDAGATGVLVSPFRAPAFINAVRLAERHAQRVADAAASTDPTPRSDADELTGLPRGERLQHWLEARAAAPATVIAVGIARFAQINAAYGRDIADRLLAAVARRLAQIADGRGPAGGERLLARLAAAEFGLGLSGAVTPDAAHDVAAGLLRAFDRPFAIDDRLIHLAGRAGIAGDGGGADADAAAERASHLLRAANAALVTAQRGDSAAIAHVGRGRDADSFERLAQLESDLHQAMVSDGIRLVFQPQLAMASGALSGVEALARWDHPRLGQLSAATLMETAAAAGLAVRLGRHIRSRAIAAAARWTGGLAALKLAVNVTAADLADPEFADQLALALASGGLAPSRLVLEVTEDALIADIDAAAGLLAVLRADGVTVALDDFGTGYSSLARLARLPIDAIKLDRSFTLGLCGDERERVIVKGVISISHMLGVQVTAEGVEDDIQLDAARAAGADLVQGYRVAPAMDEPALAAFCTGWSARDLASKAQASPR